MTVHLDIGFDQLVQLAKKLSEKQWKKLKEEVEKDSDVTETSDMEQFLLSAPTFTQEQLDEIAETRKAFNKWRTK